MVTQVDLLSPPVNFAVVQLPERMYPGVVVQGDTLYTLQQQAEKMGRLLNAGELGDLAGEIQDLQEQLSDAQTYFERICAERGIALPY